MDALQYELTRVALDTVGIRGFVLGGGHAVAIHGMAARPSEDIDLFSNARGGPGEVADDVIRAFERSGYAVNVVRRTEDLVQMTVSDGKAGICKVDLGVFWRARLPVTLDIGPVLHPDDAVAGKMDALFNRWAPRDYLDIDTILTSGRYTRKQLLAIAVEHNPGFDPAMFAESLSFLHRMPDRDFAAYGVTASEIADMRGRFADWEAELTAAGGL